MLFVDIADSVIKPIFLDFKGVGMDDFIVGQKATLSKVITDKDVRDFANLSGDLNPIHIDELFASQSRYKRRIAHGLYSASFFSAIFGTKLPGLGCVLVSQSLEFKRPVYIGDVVQASVEIIEIDKHDRKIYFFTECRVKNKATTTGNACIYIPKDKKAN